MSFQQGLSGLNGAQKALDAISNNVANANTVGFKASQVQFSDVYAIALSGGGAGVQIGIGSNVAQVAQQFTQGNLSITSNPLDLAINGNGFFRMNNGGNVSFSRNGQFNLDKDGYIVNSSGYRLTGYGAGTAGNIISGVYTDLRVQATQGSPQQTGEMSMSINVDARETAVDIALKPFSINDPLSYNSSTSMTVFDTEGFPHTLSLFFAKRGANDWDMYQVLDLDPASVVPPVPAAPAVHAGTAVTFGTDGRLTPATMSLTAGFPVTTGGANLSIDEALTITQYGSEFGVSNLSQDGYTVGQVSGVSVAQDGIVQVRYSNGQTIDLGQVVLANFANPNGLLSLGGNQWAETPDSGQPVPNTPGSNGTGVIQAASVEESNVDLTQELVNMITQQRNYQANAQSIRTQDQLMQTLVNLR